MKKQEIIKKVLDTFEKNSILVIILFGNRNGSDIDIFVVLKDDSFYNNTIVDNIDITHIGSKWIDILSQNLDPILTEPILTGEIIYGDINFIEDTKKKIKVNDGASNYLYQNAFLFYQWISAFIEIEDYEKALINISFTYSYLYYAIEYLNSKKVLTYQEISNKYPILKETKNLIKKHDSVTKEEIFCLMKKLKSDLTKTSNSLELT